MDRMRQAGLGDIPVVVGGIIPPEDAKRLKASGIAAIYTPKDYDLSAIMKDIVALIEGRLRQAA
jgi:(2R)-ethylmalonyl-CoA mutase